MKNPHHYSAFGCFLTLVLSATTYAGSSPEHEQRQPVVWSSQLVSGTLAPGSSQRRKLLVTANKRVNHRLFVYVSRSISSYVTVTPRSLSSLPKGKSVDLKFKLNVPLLAESGVRKGFVQVLQIKGESKFEPVSAKLPI